MLRAPEEICQCRFEGIGKGTESGCEQGAKCPPTPLVKSKRPEALPKP